MSNVSPLFSRAVVKLTLLTALLAAICAVLGLFGYSSGEAIPFQNVYGERLELHGKGLYRHDWAFKVPIQQGTDAVILFIGMPLLLYLLFLERRGSLRARLLLCGILAVFFYNAASTVFGVAFNPLFPVYIGYLSAALFALIFAMRELDIEWIARQFYHHLPWRGMAIFLIVSALSTSIWLFEILPAVFSGRAPATLGSYTTEVTAILDWGIVAPLFLWTALNLLNRRPLGVVLAPILTFFMVLVGVVVMGQRLMQALQAEAVTFLETGVYVLPFILLGGIGTALLVRYLQALRPS